MKGAVYLNLLLLILNPDKPDPKKIIKMAERSDIHKSSIFNLQFRHVPVGYQQQEI